jgi:hypothetical protein
MSFYDYENDYDEALLLASLPSPSSPKLINDNVMDELCKYFKLSNLLNMIRVDDKEKQKHDVTISNTIMNSIIDKKLGSITYHYNNTKSKKAYHTYDYPEVYYNKNLYNNTTDWINNEFINK